MGISHWYEIEQLVKEVKSLQMVNYEMMDILRSQLVWLIQYCGRNNIILPDIQAVFALIDQSGKILGGQSSPTKLRQPDKTPDEDNTTKRLVATRILVIF